jgi:hypothetical protein
LVLVNGVAVEAPLEGTFDHFQYRSARRHRRGQDLLGSIT